MSEARSFGPSEVQNFLPHRFPFLFVDRIESLEVAKDKDGSERQLGTKVVGIKAATINEPYFVGHFPGMPITPGVVLIETMAQVASFALFPWVKGEADTEYTYEMRLAGVDGARFRKPFVPGDVLRITAEVIKYRNPLWGFKCVAVSALDGSVVAECELLASVSIERKK